MAGIVQIMHDLVKESREQANTIVEEVQKGRNNVGKLVHDFRNDPETTHAFIKDHQKWRENAMKVINDHDAIVDTKIKAELITDAAMSDKVYDVKKAEYATLKETVKDALNLLLKRPDYSADIMADVPALLSLTTGKETGNGQVSGTKRPRLEMITVNKVETFSEKTDPKTKEVTRSFTFSAAALYITADVKDAKVKVTASDLSAVAFETVGSENLSDMTSIEYVYTVTDSKDVLHSYDILVIPTNREDNATEEAPVVEEKTKK